MRENAQRLAYEACGRKPEWVGYEDKIEKVLLNANKAPGTEFLDTRCLERRRRAHGGRVRAVRAHRLHHPEHEPDLDGGVQCRQHGGGGQRRPVQRPPRRQGGAPTTRFSSSTTPSSRRAGPRTWSAPRPSRRSRPPAVSSWGTAEGQPPDGHGRHRSRPRGDAEREAGDLRRPGNPPVVVDETADIEAGGTGHRPRGLVRQQHHLHRREGGLRVASIADDLKGSCARTARWRSTARASWSS